MTVKVTLLPAVRVVSLPQGSMLSEALLNEGMLFPCAGRGLCGKCRVTIKGAVQLPTEIDCKLLSAAEIKAGVRLACQYKLMEDTTVLLPHSIKGEVELFKKLEPGAGTYYLAVDLGTTTLKESLYNAQTGELVAKVKVANKQGSVGADILSRLSYAVQSVDNWKQLQDLIGESINQGLEMIIAATKIQVEQIIAAAFAGNTVMTALFLGRYTESPWNLADFVREQLEEEWSSAELGLKLANFCNFKIFPPLAKQVGGDLLAGIWGVDLYRDQRVKMLIDIGTNVEIALYKDGHCYVCSTAAGPAFEAVNIAQGMPALPGAICQVCWQEHQFQLKTIANQPAVGICGSGLFSALSTCLQAGLVLRSGKIKQGRTIALAENVCLTQNDLRQFQLAKAAVRTGIDIMLQCAEIAADEVEAFFIAGDFGINIAVTDLVEVGVIPKSFSKKTKLVGNSCLQGLKKALFSGGDPIEIKYTHIDLADYRDFESKFINNISF